MTLSFRRAGLEDLPLLVESRVKVLRAANRLPESADLSLVEAQSRAYYEAALRDGSHIAYLVFDGAELCGTGGVSFYRVMPTVHNPTGRKAYLMNLYTAPSHRRRGVARRTLGLLVAASRERGVLHITLEATDQGRPLYERFGFVSVENEMRLPEERLPS